MTELRPRALTLLLVEDSPATQHLQTVTLEAVGRFRTLTAKHGGEALEILRREVVDAVVTDLNMPVLDGFQLIAQISTRYPGLPVFVLTEIPDPTRVDPAIAKGCLHIHSKPPDYHALAAQIYAVRKLPQSVVRGVSMPSLLQLLQWEGRTATITVHSGALLGRLYVDRGTLIQAETGEAQGLEAAYAICDWPAPSVEFVDTCRIQGAFSLSAEALQMELALRRDEGHA